MNGTVGTKPYHPPEVNDSNNLTEITRRNQPNPINTEVRRIIPNTKVQSLKPRPTSRVGTVTWKVIYSTLGQETWTSSPGR